MRKSSLAVGCWCGAHQLAQIYALSFLWSATPRTSLLMLASWLLGSWWGVGQVGRLRRWQWFVPGILLLLGIQLQLGTVFLVGCFLSSSFWAGAIGGHWLSLLELYLITALRWECVGMGLGALVAGYCTFQGLQTLQLWVLSVSSLVAWKESQWRSAA